MSARMNARSIRCMVFLLTREGRATKRTLSRRSGEASAPQALFLRRTAACETQSRSEDQAGDEGGDEEDEGLSEGGLGLVVDGAELGSDGGGATGKGSTARGDAGVVEHGG